MSPCIVDSGTPPGIYCHFVHAFTDDFEYGQATVDLYNGVNKLDSISSPVGNLTYWNTLYINTARNNYTIVNKLSADSGGCCDDRC